MSLLFFSGLFLVRSNVLTTVLLKGADSSEVAKVVHTISCLCRLPFGTSKPFVFTGRCTTVMVVVGYRVCGPRVIYVVVVGATVGY